MKLVESGLPQMYSKYLFEEKNSDLSPDHTDKIADILFTGTAVLLNATKSMSKPTAFVFSTVDKKVAGVAVVQYFKNENKDNPGNWSLIWSFDEADIPTDALRIDINDAQSHSYFRAVAGEKYGIRFDTQSALEDLTVGLLLQLKKYLDENASESGEFSIEMDGIFQARSAVENGEKVFAIEAAGEVKNLIKDDAAIEK